MLVITNPKGGFLKANVASQNTGSDVKASEFSEKATVSLYDYPPPMYCMCNVHRHDQSEKKEHTRTRSC